MVWPLLRLWIAAPSCLLLSCLSAGPTVEAPPPPPRDALARVAVLPFSAAAQLGGGQLEGVELIERYVTEAIARGGVDVIPAQELRIAFAARRQEIPAGAAAGAQRAATDFGATALLMGQVSHYRERRGDRFGSDSPARVAFRVSLHAAPTGTRLWSASFDETQVALLDSPARARRYPDGGRRWLSAAELARWGARELAATLLPPTVAR